MAVLSSRRQQTGSGRSVRAACRVLDHCHEVSRIGSVIKASQPIGLATAPAIVPRECIPSSRIPRRYQAAGNRIGCLALEALRENDQPIASNPGPIEIEEIAVGEFQPFAFIPHLSSSRKNGPEDRLHMRAA